MFNPFKRINSLKKEKSSMVGYLKFNNEKILFFESKKVLTGRESRELSQTKTLSKEIATDIYFIEKDIDKILIDNPHLNMVGYTPVKV